MTYEPQIVEVGGIPLEVPCNYNPVARDESCDCWVITLVAKKLSCPPFQIRWWNSGKNIATGMGSVLDAFPNCVILDWQHLNDLPDEF